MKNFFNITKGELMKSFKGKGMLIALIIVIGVTIVMALIFGLTVEQYLVMYPPDENAPSYDPKDVKYGIELEMQENDLAYASGEISQYEHDIKNFQFRSNIAVVNYMIKHNLKFGDYDVFHGSEMLMASTTQNFILFAMSSAGMIIAIIASIYAAGTLSDEINNGTMRLLLICPVGRFKLIIAKITAVMVQLAVVLITFTLSSVVLGIIMYPSVFKPIMIVFNASKAALISFSTAILLNIGLLLLYGLIITVIIVAFVSIFRSKVFGIVLGVILSTNILTTALLIRPQLTKVFSLTIFTNMNFAGFFTTTGNNYGQITLPMALLVYIINIIVLLGLSGLIFKQRDIH